MRWNSAAGSVSVVCISGATEHSMLSSASERLNRRSTPGERAQGVFLALLVQASFVAMILLSSQHATPLRTLAHETILILHPTPQTAPSSIDARGSMRRPAPVIAPVLPAIAPLPPIAPSPDIAPPSGIAGFGRSLFGCAPEHYADLPPTERAHCPKPGEGMAINQPPDLMRTRSHVKNEAHWRQEWERVHSPSLLPCGGFRDVMCLLGMIADGSLSDNGDPSKWPTYAVKQLPDRDFRKIEETYQAWNRDHPVPPPKN
jgi:hypothetical protein